MKLLRNVHLRVATLDNEKLSLAEKSQRPQRMMLRRSAALCRQCKFLNLSRGCSTRFSTAQACRWLHSTPRRRDHDVARSESRLYRPTTGHAETQQDGPAHETAARDEDLLEPSWVETASENPTDESIARQARQEHGEHLPEGHLSEGQLKIYIRLYGEP